MGRRPELKSNEKSKGIPIVLEISGCEHVFTAEKVLYILGASVTARKKTGARKQVGRNTDRRPHLFITMISLMS